MSSFLSKPSLNFLTHNQSTLRPQFSNSRSFSFFRKPTNFKSSSVSVSYQQQQPSHQGLKSSKTQCDKHRLGNPYWVLAPCLLQYIKMGVLFLKTYLQKWGYWFRAFKESHKALELDEETLGFLQNDGKNLVFLQSGGIGMTLLSVTSTAKLQISPYIARLAANPTFVSGMFAWMSAQSMKVVLNFFVERRWDYRIMFASGGMPSSHSALCTALTTSVALCHGVADSLFPVCLGFSLIVMYDAIGVRRHAGMQAEVLNVIIADLFQGHPISQRKLKELLGHTPSQVLAGAFLGIVVACICCQGSLVPA